MFEAAEGLGEHVNLIWKPPKQRLSENEKIDAIKTVQNAYYTGIVSLEESGRAVGTHGICRLDYFL